MWRKNTKTSWHNCCNISCKNQTIKKSPGASPGDFFLTFRLTPPKKNNNESSINVHKIRTNSWKNLRSKQFMKIVDDRRFLYQTLFIIVSAGV